MHKRTDEIREGEPPICDDALDLVELGQVRRVHRLVTEHPVDREQLRGPEAVIARLARPRDSQARVRALPLHHLVDVRFAVLTTTCPAPSVR